MPRKASRERRRPEGIFGIIAWVAWPKLRK
jgi:hypothetical protein